MTTEPITQGEADGLRIALHRAGEYADAMNRRAFHAERLRDEAARELAVTRGQRDALLAALRRCRSITEDGTTGDALRRPIHQIADAAIATAIAAAAEGGAS